MAEGLPEAVAAAIAQAIGPGVVECVDPAGRTRRAGMSETARLIVDRGALGPARVFAKWPSHNGRVHRIARYSGSYLREIMFYRHLAESCPIRVPQALLAEHDAATGDFVLLLEDPVSARAGDSVLATPDDVRRALQAIAALHARWLDDGRLAELPWLPGPGDPGVARYVGFEVDRLARGLSLVRFGEAADRMARRLLSMLVDRVEDIVPSTASAGQTLVHGDLHADQVLFHDGAGNVVDACVIVDWQTVRRANMGVDTARLIMLSLPVEVRRAHEAELLEAYRRAFTGAGGGRYDSATCLADYRGGLAWTAFVNLSFFVSALRDTDAATDFQAEMIDRVTAAAADHGMLGRSG